MERLLRDLKAAGYGVWGLTNWSHETFHFAFEKFPQLAELLQGTVVSGVEKMHKPNADIYELAMSRFGLSPESSVFLDDTAKNVAGRPACTPSVSSTPTRRAGTWNPWACACERGGRTPASRGTGLGHAPISSSAVGRTSTDRVSTMQNEAL